MGAGAAQPCHAREAKVEVGADGALALPGHSRRYEDDTSDGTTIGCVGSGAVEAVSSPPVAWEKVRARVAV